MRRHAGTAAVIVGSLLVILTGSPAEAAPTQVNVRIEGRSETLFEGPIWTEGRDVKASSDTEERQCDGRNNSAHRSAGPTPTAASVDAMSLIGETFDGQWYPGYEDYFITRWGPDQQDPSTGAYWGILVNNVFTNVGGCQYELGSGDEVLWVYDAFQSRPLLALLAVKAHYTSGERPLTATAELGKPFEVEVLEYGDQEEDTPPAEPERGGTTPFAGADVSPVQTSDEGYERVEVGSADTVVTNAQGKASITFTTPGWHRIKATKLTDGNEAAIRSNRLDVCVPATGEHSCGAEPIEDTVRTPPTVAQELEHAHDVTPEEEPSSSPESKPVEINETGTVENTNAQQQSGGTTGQQSSATGSGTTITAATTSTDHTTSLPTTVLVITSINPARLLLKLTAPGVARVRIARLRGKGHHRRLQTIKTITIKASKAGVLEVKLPRLPAGSYRVSTSLAGAKTVLKTLTVTNT